MYVKIPNVYSVQCDLIEKTEYLHKGGVLFDREPRPRFLCFI